MSLYDHSVERAALACAMENAHALDDLKAIGLAERHFHKPWHGVLWRLVARESAFDLAGFVGANEADLRAAGIGYSEILGAQGSPHTLSRAVSYGHAVIGSYRARELRSVCLEVADGLSGGGLDFDGAAGLYDARFSAARDEGGSASDPESMESMMLEWAKERRAVLAGEKQPSTISTGMRSLDALMPLGRGHQVIVAGRPKMGKTTFSLTVAMNVSRAKGPVLFCSAEMGRGALMERIADHELNHSTLSRFDSGVARLAAKAHQCRRLWFDYRNRSAQKVEASIRRWHRKTGGLALVVIDYLQLLTGDNRDERQRIAEASGRFKRLASEIDVPFMTLAQLNRDCEKRDDKRPQVWDLKGSGDIEQDADSVLMLYRGSVYDEPNYPEGRCEALLRASRWASPGRAFLRWTPGNGWFADEAQR